MPEPSSKLPQFHVVGFSGHRVLENPAGVARAIADELRALRQDAAGEWIALSSIAAGSDQIFVREARQLGMSWHAILPLPRSEFAADFSREEWPQVEATLERAEHIRIITENGTREDAYLDCGMETANGADVLIAVWDGEPARGRGGTADVVHYARTQRKPIIIIDPATLHSRRESFHLLERVDKTLLNLNLLPDATSWGDNPFKAPAHIFAFQQKCDHTASKGAPQFRRLIVLTVLLHVLATVIAAATLAFDLHLMVLPWLKFICLAAALGVALVLRHHHHSHHSWVRCRLAAEFCRSALATWGLPRAAPLFEDLDVPGIRGLARTLHILHGRSAALQSVSMEEFKRIYLEKRVDDQLAYYRRQESRALPLFSRLKVGFWIATLTAITCTLVYAIAETIHAPWFTPELRRLVFYFLPISLPVVAASFISLISINDLQRRVARFREMQLVLENSKKRVTFCTTWNSLEQIVLKTERALLHEVLEWHSITSFAESH